MNYTYIDLNIYQSQLKSLFKFWEPNMYLCYLIEEPNPTLITLNNQPTKKLANLIVGIRTAGINCYKAAEIYSNGHIVNNALSYDLLNALIYWLWGDQIKTEKCRTAERNAKIKEELVATVYHPDNFKRLLDLPQHLM